MNCLRHSIHHWLIVVKQSASNGVYIHRFAIAKLKPSANRDSHFCEPLSGNHHPLVSPLHPQRTGYKLYIHIQLKGLICHWKNLPNWSPGLSLQAALLHEQNIDDRRAGYVPARRWRVKFG